MQSSTTEVQEYRKRYGSQGITPEDVTLLKFLEERYARDGMARGLEQGMEQGMEQGVEQGVKQGILRGRIATVEDMLARGASWETVTQFTGVNETRLIRLRKELATLQNGHSTHGP